MGKSSPKSPTPPDPAATAAAQTASNKETAYWNAVLNNVNQVTPYGNLTYKQTGGGKTYNTDAYNKALETWSSTPSQMTPQTTYSGGPGQRTTMVDSRGAAPKLEDFFTGESPPQFTSTIELSPEQKAIYDSQTRSQGQLSTLGEEQIGRIRNSVSTPFSFEGVPDAFSAEDAQTASRRGEEALMSRLDPQFARDEEALRTRLINQGIGQGSQAYNTEFDRFNQARNDARSQAILQGANYGGTLQDQAMQRRNQGINEYTTQRNAPLNEYIGLTSGVQVQNPQFNSQGYQGAQGVDYAGLVNQQYQGQLGNYNSKVASNNATQGSLFGLGGSLLGATAGTGAAGSAGWLAMLSDERLKENIVKIGSTPAGLGVYEYNFIGSDKVETGVLAQEVEKAFPHAVVTGDDGYKRVYYAEVR
jgi:hypothetical protein